MPFRLGIFQSGNFETKTFWQNFEKKIAALNAALLFSSLGKIGAQFRAPPHTPQYRITDMSEEGFQWVTSKSVPLKKIPYKKSSFRIKIK